MNLISQCFPASASTWSHPVIAIGILIMLSWLRKISWTRLITNVKRSIWEGKNTARSGKIMMAREEKGGRESEEKRTRIRTTNIIRCYVFLCFWSQLQQCSSERLQVGQVGQACKLQFFISKTQVGISGLPSYMRHHLRHEYGKFLNPTHSRTWISIIRWFYLVFFTSTNERLLVWNVCCLILFCVIVYLLFQTRRLHNE